jgi:regulatory protein
MPPQRRPTPPLTADALENAALVYLARYQTSAENLRRVLTRRVERAARAGGADRTTAKAWVERLIARFRNAGILDDRAYAEARVAALRRAGASRRAIRARLLKHGVAPDVVEAALKSGAERDHVDLVAAAVLARRRRLGPYRRGRKADGWRERELALLARAGFSYAVARTVVDAKSIEELEQQARED